MKYKTPRYNEQITKLCKGCGRRIPNYTKICPHCFRKQKDAKQIILKVITIYLFICLLASVFIVIDSGEDNSLGACIFLLVIVTIISKKVAKKEKKDIYVDKTAPKYNVPNYTMNYTQSNSKPVEKKVQTRVVMCEACGAPNTLSTDVGECEYCGMPIS